MRGDLLHRRRNSGRISYVDREDQDDIYTDGGVRGDLLHRRLGGAEVFYIHIYQMVALLFIWNYSRCNLWLF